jgi:transcriptional regulator with XRE-family HTH domain
VSDPSVFNVAAIARRVEEMRRARGKTQHECAEHLGMSRMTYSTAAKGRREFKPSELVALAALLGCEVSSLVSDTATRRETISPLLMVADLCEWVHRLDAGDVSEGHFAKFLGLDRVSARVVAESCRSMSAVVARQLGKEQS